LIDDFQLEAALSHQRNWGGKLGSIIVELEFAREEDIARVISEKMGVPYVNLFEPELSPEVVKLLKADMAKKFGVVPVRKEANALVLAMSDPMDFETMDNVRFITGLTIKPVLAMGAEIKDAIRKYYDGEPVTRKAVVSFRETAKKSTKLEIVREMPDIATTEWSQQYQQQDSQTLRHDTQSLRQDFASQKVILEALISLLIEKDFFTRDEIAKIIEQKKMGL
jgi:type II secretory ATPase GspE/PulE/Tfp pilus assembly ATPase PilB-like protein